MGDRVYHPKRRRKITNQSHNRDNTNTNTNDWEALVRPSVNVQQPQQATVTPKLTSTTVVNEQRDENWKTRNSEQDCTGKTQPYSLMNGLNANFGKYIDDKHNQKTSPNPQIKPLDSPLRPTREHSGGKRSIQPPHMNKTNSIIRTPSISNSSIIGVPPRNDMKPDDDTPLTEILRAAGDGNNHLVQSSRIPIKSIMEEEEITYDQLGTFGIMEFRTTFNLKYGPTQKIVEAAKQYNSKQRKFLTSPGEFDKKMSANSSATMGATSSALPPPDHSSSSVDDDLSWMTGQGNENRVLQKINNNCTTTITKSVELMNWYDNNLADGVTWKQEQPNTICKKILQHFTKYDKLQQRFEERKKGTTTKFTTTTTTTTLRPYIGYKNPSTVTMTTVLGYKDPSTKRSYLQSFLSILNTEDRMDQLHVQAKKLVVDKMAIYSSQETKLKHFYRY